MTEIEKKERQKAALMLAAWRCSQAGKHDMARIWALKLRELICAVR